MSVSEFKRLSAEERQQIILESLRPGANLTQIAKEHGINRNTIYKYHRYSLRDPHQLMLDAEAEAAFRRQVWEMVR